MGKLIYVVDDEENILEILEYNLMKNGYEVKSFKNGGSFLSSFNLLKPDLVILDLMLPDMDGLDICRQIKNEAGVPVIILSAKGEELDRVLGLELGADDYISKPFGVRELLARVKNILRRIDNGAQNESKKKFKKEFDFEEIKLFVDEAKHEVFLDSKRIQLNPKEFKIILRLLENINVLIPRMGLIKMVWGDDYYGDTRTLDVHIRRIRKKMAYRGFSKKFIKTVHGYGYKMTDSI
jgi:two-component system, OmpR family, alkaline phosphatase synthesis response regulator PhoP